MKRQSERYWILTGALSIASAAGLYQCSRNTFYKQEDGFVQEDLDVPQTGLEDPEIKIPDPIHHGNLNAKKENDKRKPERKELSSPGKKNNWAKPHEQYRSASPINQHLEEKVEEDAERPWYDLTVKERDLLGDSETAKYFYAALEADDYKVAESYIENAQRFSERRGEDRHSTRKDLTTIIISGYNNFLDKIIGDCNKDYDSVFRKVMWMNFFMVTNEDIFPLFLPLYQVNVKSFTLFDLLLKGDEALEAIEYCIEKKDN